MTWKTNLGAGEQIESGQLSRRVCTGAATRCWDVIVRTIRRRFMTEASSSGEEVGSSRGVPQTTQNYLNFCCTFGKSEYVCSLQIIFEMESQNIQAQYLLWREIFN